MLKRIIFEFICLHIEKNVHLLSSTPRTLLKVNKTNQINI